MVVTSLYWTLIADARLFGSMLRRAPWIVAFVVGVLLLSGCTPHAPIIVVDDGELNLPADVDTVVYRIEGRWEAYPGEALTPDEIDARDRRSFHEVPAPHGWLRGADGSRVVYGTSTFRIDIAEIPRNTVVALQIPRTEGTIRVWINGERVMEHGERGSAQAGIIPLIATDSGAVTLTVQLSGLHAPNSGFSLHPPRVGPQAQIAARWTRYAVWIGVALGMLLALIGFHAFFAVGPARAVPHRHLAVLFVVMLLHVTLVHGELIVRLTDAIPSALALRIRALGIYPLLPFAVALLRHLFPEESRHWSLRAGTVATWVVLAVALAVPRRFTLDVLYLWGPIVLLTGVGVTGAVARALYLRREGATAMAAAAGATIALVGWAVLVHIGAVSAGEWLGAWGIVLVAVLLSVSLLQRSNEFRVSISALREQAQHDGLTGMWNRRTFDTRLADEWLRHIRSQQPLGLIMVDVDHFKGYNDTLGHPAGDTVLRKIATVIDAHAKRSADIAARYGGEEFVLVLPHSDTTGVYQVAERIRAAVEALQITHPVTAAGTVTVSVGASVYRPEAGQHGEASPLTLIEAADRALYEAKDAGRNAVRLQPVETGL